MFHLPAGIIITSVDPSPTELVMGVACQAPRMQCPECHQLSARMHGSYQRTVADLPCAGRNVILALTVVLATYDIRREIDSLPHQLTDLLTTNKLISRSLGYILVSQT